VLCLVARAPQFGGLHDAAIHRREGRCARGIPQPRRGGEGRLLQTPAGALRERFPAQDGTQPGDPRKAAEAIIKAVRDESSPLRLPLGQQAVSRIRAKLEGQLADLRAWEKVSLDTSY
jgi:hypothetical protein